MINKAYLYVRSVVLWILTLLNFGAGTALLLLLRLLFEPRKFEWVVWLWFRAIHVLAGIKVRYVVAPGFDPARTSLFVSNHVNLFDPFVLYLGFPQLARGLELESHFEIPVYGLLMRKFGNVPVPDMRSASGLKKTLRLTRQTLDSGMSLVIFPEGSRTLTGRVGPFEDGAFLLAQKFEYPLVPLSIVGSFEFKRKGNWLLRPATITVYVHDTIDTENLTKKDIPVLRQRVRDIVAAPVHQHQDRLQAQRSGTPLG